MRSSSCPLDQTTAWIRLEYIVWSLSDVDRVKYRDAIATCLQNYELRTGWRSPVQSSPDIWSTFYGVSLAKSLKIDLQNVTATREDARRVLDAAVLAGDWHDAHGALLTLVAIGAKGVLDPASERRVSSVLANCTKNEDSRCAGTVSSILILNSRDRHVLDRVVSDRVCGERVNVRQAFECISDIAWAAHMVGIDINPGSWPSLDVEALRVRDGGLALGSGEYSETETAFRALLLRPLWNRGAVIDLKELQGVLSDSRSEYGCYSFPVARVRSEGLRASDFTTLESTYFCYEALQMLAETTSP